VSGVVKEHLHALVGQGWVKLQVPLQVVVWKFRDNCRAESVPALRTRVTMTAKKRVWIFFFMIDSPFSWQLSGNAANTFMIALLH
jgi:hypothetical protein